MASIKVINSRRLINYLANNKVYPIEENQGYAVYWRSPQLSCLLERFTIEKYLIPNKY